MKKLFALLLTALMLVSCMSVVASADETELRELIIWDCDTAFGSFVLDTETKTQGEASCSCVLDGNKVNSTTDILVDISAYDTLEMDIWVSNPEFFTLGVESQFELSSSGTCDQQEMAWTLPGLAAGLTEEAKEGWNHIVLPYADMNTDMDKTAVNWLRYYIVNTDGVKDKQITYKLDNVKVSNRHEIELAAAKESIKPVLALFDAIGLGDAEVTAANYDAVKAATEAAREAYNALTQVEKDAMDSSEYKILSNAEKAVKKYEKAIAEAANTEVTETKANEPADTSAAGEETKDAGTTEEKNSTGLIIGIVAAVVVIAAIVVFLLAKKKK